MKHSDKKLALGIILGMSCIFVGALLYCELQQREEMSLVKTQPPVESVAEVEQPVAEESSEESESIQCEEPVRELTGAEELDEGIIVYAPEEMEWEDAIALLESRRKEDDRYEKILDQLDSYPKMLLMNLVVNPEMISFVYDYPEGTGLEPVIRQVEMEQKCPLFLQWDKRWGYCRYGEKSTIAVSGCGPTALSMVTTALTHEPVTPLEVAEYAMEKEYYLPGVGTMWSLMTAGAKDYGLDSEQIDPDEYVMKKMLDRGELLICSMRKGDFTINGHFIVIYGYDKEGFLVNDPMCIYRSKQHWGFQQLKKQFKALWSLCPEGQKPEEFYRQPETSQAQEAEPDPGEAESSVPETNVVPPQSVTPGVPQEPVSSEPESSDASSSESSESSPETGSESESEASAPSEPVGSEDTEPSDSETTEPSDSEATEPAGSSEEAAGSVPEETEESDQGTDSNG